MQPIQADTDPNASEGLLIHWEDSDERVRMNWIHLRTEVVDVSGKWIVAIQDNASERLPRQPCWVTGARDLDESMAGPCGICTGVQQECASKPDEAEATIKLTNTATVGPAVQEEASLPITLIHASGM
jgi:hypothetical protein